MALTPNIEDTISQFKSGLDNATKSISGADIKNKLESTMNGISSKIDVGKIQSATDKLVTKDLMAATTKLGSSLEESIGGFQALTKTVDDIVPKLEEISKPLQNTAKQFAENADDIKDLVGKIPVAQLTKDVKNIGDKLVRDLESEDIKGKLEAITGKASLAAKELIDVVVASPIPEAMTKALDTVASDARLDFKIAVDEMKDILKDNIDVNLPLGEAITGAQALLAPLDDIAEEMGSILDDTLTDIVGTNLTASLQGFKLPSLASLGDIGSLSSLADGFKDLATGEISKALGPIQNGFGSIMENVVETSLAPAAGALSKIAKVGDVKIEIPKPVVTNVIKLKTAGDLDGAVAAVQKYSDAPADTIADTVSSIDAKSSTATAGTTQGVEIVTGSVKDWIDNWRENPNLSPYFALNYPTLNTKEEIVADLRSMKRQPVVSFITCTSTGTDYYEDAVSLHARYYEAFNVGIPYHYLINKDGTIEKARPLDTKIPSSKNLSGTQLAWQNAGVSVIMIGGCNAPQETPDLEKYAGKKGYSEKQWTSFYRLTGALIEVFPGISITGLDAAGGRPFFNVPDVIKARYNRSNPIPEDELITDEMPPTPADIAKTTGPY